MTGLNIDMFFAQVIQYLNNAELHTLCGQQMPPQHVIMLANEAHLSPALSHNPADPKLAL